KELISNLIQRLQRAMDQQLKSSQQSLAGLSRTLQAISPLNTLSRGYAIATDESGNPLTRAQQVKKDDNIMIRLYKGKISARVQKTLKS
ncbi:MAG: exodeoxyribonuclease VII large subunit, partial [Gammaproteobacteria bacterium]|nr:exodeoxyribonuclease VII large subunit [Gammaproteobacteria bacterium]